MRALATLLGVANSGARGPSPSFTRAHLLLAFLTIGNNGFIGRQALAKESGLGEGATRTVLRRMRGGGFVAVNASGAFLTKKGKELLRMLNGRLLPFADLESSKLTVGREQAAVGVRGSSRRLGNGIPQRDSAIMVGATAVTTYLIRGSRFTIPGGSNDCEKDFPSGTWKSLRDKLAPRNGDIVIVCGAGDALKAKLGALSAALTLL
jgi:uncharacterized protein DUF4443